MTSDDQSNPPEAPRTRRELRAAERTRMLAEQERLRRAEEADAGGPAPTSDAGEPAAEAGGEQTAGAEPEGARDALPQLPPVSGESVGDPTADTARVDAERTDAVSDDPAAVPGMDGSETRLTSAPETSDSRSDTAQPAREGDEHSASSADDAFADIFGEDSLVGAHTPTKRRRRGPRLGMIIAIGVALVVVGGSVFLAWNVAGNKIAEFFHNEPIDYEGGGNGQIAEVTIMPGDTGTDIGVRLEEAGVVKTSKAFVQSILARPEEPQFQPGTYSLQKEMSADAALIALIDEDNRIENKLTIPEGTRESSVYALIEETYGIPADELEKLAKDPQQFGLPKEAKSMEGFLFPATYTFAPDVSAKEVLQAMSDRTMESLDAAGVAEKDRWDIIRMASLVEKEARLPDDFPKVAQVFYNRLDIDMPLQSDATVTYWTQQSHRAATTKEERQDADNPYNTYVHKGMIPGPISNPGDVAIAAATNPTEGPWLYFVTVNLETGETVFSETYEEHEKAVDQWLQWMEDNPDYQ